MCGRALEGGHGEYRPLWTALSRNQFSNLGNQIGRHNHERLPLGLFCGFVFGHLFVFANRRRDRVKILYWDRDGFAIWAKRLEEGTYAMPFGAEGEVRREITAQELGALLSGIDLSQAVRRKRYARKSVATA